MAKASGGKLAYISKLDLNRSQSITNILKRDMGRPFCTLNLCLIKVYPLTCASADFLVTEPIVLLLAIYIAIAYATLYAFFAAYPIVFQQHRGFSQGEGGLVFLGIGLGCLIGLSMAPMATRLYWKAMDRNDGRTIPEA